MAIQSIINAFIVLENFSFQQKIQIIILQNKQRTFTYLKNYSKT